MDGQHKDGRHQDMSGERMSGTRMSLFFALANTNSGSSPSSLKNPTSVPDKLRISVPDNLRPSSYCGVDRLGAGPRADDAPTTRRFHATGATPDGRPAATPSAMDA